jgi:hypothetical protein
VRGAGGKGGGIDDDRISNKVNLNLKFKKYPFAS